MVSARVDVRKPKRLNHEEHEGHEDNPSRRLRAKDYHGEHGEKVPLRQRESLVASTVRGGPEEAWGPHGRTINSPRD
jgi:hypothetical protein